MGPQSILPLIALGLPVGKLLLVLIGGALALLALGLRLRQTMVVPVGFLPMPQPEIRKLRRVTEDEVIAEFLKNEFHHPDFDEARAGFAPIVLNPNLQDAGENARRRQLLFRKRGGLWRELPVDTRWWEVSVGPRALGRVRVFPRADWRRYSQNGFSLPQFASRIAAELAQASPDPFLSSLRGLQQLLAKGGPGGSVLLIGVDEEKPLTIIEGNHRMVAAALLPPPQLHGFRFFCGFSPRMSHCCWYQGSMANLLHYAGNLLRDLRQFRHSDLARILPRRRLAATATAAAAPPTLQLSGTGLQLRDGGLKVKDPNGNSTS